MDENWDDCAPVEASIADFSKMGINGSDGGSSFSKGRGYSSYGNGGNGDGWDNDSSAAAGGWDDWNQDNNVQGGYKNLRGGRNGRGDHKPKGDRFGRGGFGNQAPSGWDDCDGADNGDYGRHGDRPRGRGGRGGRGRGGGGGGDGNYENDGEWGSSGFKKDGYDREEKQKPREIYVPPETDDKNLFSSGLTTGINFQRYEEIDVKITGENTPDPIQSFECAKLRPLLLDNIKKSGYTKPTPIQKHSIPIVMSGRDLMACAQTGSGKTAAFLVPIIHKLISEEIQVVISEDHCEPQAVIVSPTRELAIQIFEQAKKFAYGSIIKVAVAYGGTSVFHQKSQLVSGCHILVATPGRVNDFTTRGWIGFGSTRFVVLDEADRMLDLGFLPAIQQMLAHDTMVPTGKRQTLMFSATFPEEIQHLAGQFLHNYIFIAVGIVGGACADVEQVFIEVDKYDKRNKLLEILRQQGIERTLVFVETKRNADFLASYLSENDIPTTSIHGDRLQRERELALKDFKTGNHNVLVATGVAARGLDIKNVKHVINFDLPSSIDEYVHRIGRTGRLGNSGKATSFFNAGMNRSIAGSLARILKQAGQPVPSFLECSGASDYYGSSGFGGEDVRANQGNMVEDILQEEW